MLQLGKISMKLLRRGIFKVMDTKRKLIRKRKLSNADKDVMIVVETHGTKHRKTAKNDKQQQMNKLHDKSVLLIENDQYKSCLLFLTPKQTVAVHGKVQIQALKGTVDISGFKVKPSTQTYKLLSPSSQSLFTIKECTSETNNSDNSGSRLNLSDFLDNSGGKFKKVAQSRAEKAISVLKLAGLQSPESDFICQFKDYEDIFKMDNQLEDLHSSEKTVNELTSSSGFTLLEADERFSTYHQPQEWNNIIGDFKEILQDDNGESYPSILICGGKGVGKSTFARTMINSLLNSCSEVCYLECDVGQTELTPPTILSLNCVSRPLLGPPFTHLQWPERAYFYGDISPKENPDLYINTIAKLYNHYREMLSTRPLVINTQGWVKGFGVPLLVDVIRITKPTHIVQINSSQTTKNLPQITREFLDTSPGWLWPVDDLKPKQNVADLINSLRQDNGEQQDVDITDVKHHSYPTIYQLNTCTKEDHIPSSTLRPADFRIMGTLAYFSDVLRLQQAESLIQCRPYRVPWCDVAVHVTHTMVPRSQVLVSLNASIVGLAIAPPCVLHGHDKESDLPKFIKGNPIMECVGLGIVRNIDPVNKLFYIITPVPVNKLQQVNVLIKGNLEIPSQLLVKNFRAGTPYLSSEFSYDIKGASARKVRYNLQRKKFTSPARP